MFLRQTDIVYCVMLWYVGNYDIPTHLFYFNILYMNVQYSVVVKYLISIVLRSYIVPYSRNTVFIEYTFRFDASY